MIMTGEVEVMSGRNWNDYDRCSGGYEWEGLE